MFKLVTITIQNTVQSITQSTGVDRIAIVAHERIASTVIITAIILAHRPTLASINIFTRLVFNIGTNNGWTITKRFICTNNLVYPHTNVANLYSKLDFYTVMFIRILCNNMQNAGRTRFINKAVVNMLLTLIERSYIEVISIIKWSLAAQSHATIAVIISSLCGLKICSIDSVNSFWSQTSAKVANTEPRLQCVGCMNLKHLVGVLGLDMTVPRIGTKFTWNGENWFAIKTRQNLERLGRRLDLETSRCRKNIADDW